MLRGFHVLDFDRSGIGNACIIDQDIDRATRSAERLGDTGRDLFVRRDVDFDHGNVEIVAGREGGQFIRLRTWKVAHGREYFCAQAGIMFCTETAKA